MSAELSDETIAAAYLSDRARYGSGAPAEGLIDAVAAYLTRVGLPWRSAVAVARAVDLISKPPAPRPEPPSPVMDPAESLAFEDNQRQGFGDGRTLPDVSNMSMAEYARARSQLGIGMGGDHGLGGGVRAGEYR